MEPTRAAGGELALLARAAEVSSRGLDLEAAAAVVLEESCALAGWPAGHLLVARRGREGGSRPVLAPTAAWHLSDPQRFRVLRQVAMASSAVPPAASRALETGERAAVADLGPLGEAASRAGLAAAVAFPVLAAAVGGAGSSDSEAAGGATEVAAVLAFYTEGGEPTATPRLEVVARACDQLGRVIDRQRALSAEADRRKARDMARDACVSLDGGGIVIEWNGRAEETFGWSRSEMLGRSLSEVVPLRFRTLYERALRQLGSGEEEGAPLVLELTAVHRSGAELPVELTAWASGSGEQRRLGAYLRDLTERRNLEGQLARLALHDRLTGLPNRVLLRDRLEHALVRAGARPGYVALLLLDVDRFRACNDRLGHDGGDAVLVALAERLAAEAGPADTLARVGGDQYGLLREDVGDASEVAALAERLVGLAARPVAVGGLDVAVSASAGAALSSGQEEQADLLLRDAELALERAQRHGGGRYEVFDEAVRVEASERLGIESDLRDAIRHGGLRVVYQPIVRIDTGAVAGFEALVRWTHPVRGAVGASELVAAAESTGLIVPLGRFVMTEACRQAVAWRRQGHDADPLRVSVNVSARQLAHPGWSSEVAEILDESGMEPQQLVIEITESALMEDLEGAVPLLEDLRRVGVRIAIDDFGTGYSSLGYLRRLPVDVLKIDKSFIDGIAEGPHESALARAVIKLAATLRLDAVAEGVSTRRQLAQLRRLRCPYGQGYLFARPQPAEAFTDLLARPTLVADGA